MGENIFTKSITVLVLLCAAHSQHALGQISDNFDDGNFTDAPAWSGSAGNFVVNASKRLQLNAAAAGTSTLALPFSLPAGHNAQWEFLISHGFASSGSNNSRVYLMADTDVLTGPVNGYFLQFGENGALDAVQLFRQSGNAVTSIIRGPDGDIDQADFAVRVLVTRSSLGEWQLSIDPLGGFNFTPTSVAIDNTFTSSSFFGIRCLYTITNVTKFAYDDFVISTVLAPDVTAPLLSSVYAVGANEIQLNFSEALDAMAELAVNAFIMDDTLVASGAYLLPSDSAIHLSFPHNIKNGYVHRLSLPDLADPASNVLAAGDHDFLFFKEIQPMPGDVVLSELYPDPLPSFGLPPFEFVEIYNASEHPFDLAGWELTDGTTHGVLGSYMLLPAAHLIVTLSEAVETYQQFGAAIGLQNFPSLNNSGDNIRLRSPAGVVIDSLRYSSATYRDDDKTTGGYTLERIDPKDFCKGDKNWKASEHVSGGTPGIQNSVFASSQDHIPPGLRAIQLISQDSIMVMFSERLAVSSASGSNFSFVPDLSIDTLGFVDAALEAISIRVKTQVDSITTYKLITSNIRDCPGNALHPDSATIIFRLDNIPPRVKAVSALSDSNVLIEFTERISTDSLGKMLLLDGISPQNIIVRNGRTIELEFIPGMVNGQVYSLMVQGIRDRSGNVCETSVHEVLFFRGEAVAAKDVIFTELFPDPSPVVGLPDAEFLEIYNRSNNAIQLKNWILKDQSTQVKLPSRILLPGKHLVICSASRAFLFQNALGVSSFPSLTNGGEPIVLKDSLGVTIDSLSYTDDWYRDSEKAEGGWSLELIDPANICAESENWVASEHTDGGTPGEVNSVIAEKPDLTPPTIASVVVISPDTLVITFNEKMRNVLPPKEAFVISPVVAVEAINFTDRSLRGYVLRLSLPLKHRVRYSLLVNGVFDCAGNEFEGAQPVVFALTESAEPGDIVINEVLFNPRSTGIDFVEIYNRSEKYINLKNWEGANFNNDTLSNRKLLSSSDLVLAPSDFLVVTSDPNTLKGEYLNADENRLVKGTLPSLPDDEGTFALIAREGNIIDTIRYDDGQHSPFLKNTEGVSLERIDIHSPSTRSSNWQSASAANGYATPGLPNGSAFQNNSDDFLSIEPEVFSPTAGQPDFTMISYDLEHSGYVANIHIVDSQGRIVKRVAENELLGGKGFFTWRGDTSLGTKAAIGAYMVWFEAFDNNGNKITLKKRVVVAERF